MGGLEGVYDYIYNLVRIFLLLIPAVIIALTLHEFAHAFVAVKLGDPTPKKQGRLTINPKSHFDILGFIFILLSKFGWTKPIETDSRYFKDFKKDQVKVFLAGPLMNLLLAFTFFTILFLQREFFPIYFSSKIVYDFLLISVGLNIGLFAFNLLPIPPLDGFNLLALFYEYKYYEFFSKLRSYSLPIIILVLFIGQPILAIPIFIAHELIRIYELILKIIF